MPRRIGGDERRSIAVNTWFTETDGEPVDFRWRDDLDECRAYLKASQQGQKDEV